jgi:hypothetical protein
MTVRAKHTAFSYLGQQSFHTRPVAPRADGKFLLARIAVVKIQAGGMIFTTDLTGQSFFIFSKPLLYFAVTIANVPDVPGFVRPVLAPLVLPLVLASFLRVFVRHEVSAPFVSNDPNSSGESF